MRLINGFLLLALSTFLITVYSCKKEDSQGPAVRIKTVTVENEGTFDFEGGLTYAVESAKQYAISITTEPANAEVFYAINNGAISKQTTSTIQIDSNDNYISFFSTMDGFCMVDNHRLDFGFSTDSIISDVHVYPNPTDSIVIYEIESQTRGLLKTYVKNVLGQVLQSDSTFIFDDFNSDTIDLSNYDSSIYFLFFDYGNTQIVKKIVK